MIDVLAPFAAFDWVALGIVAVTSFAVGALVRSGVGALMRSSRGLPKDVVERPGRPPMEVKPLYPTRLLVCVLATVGFCVALAVLPNSNADAVVSAYFVLLGNVVASMKENS